MTPDRHRSVSLSRRRKRRRRETYYRVDDARTAIITINQRAAAAVRPHERSPVVPNTGGEGGGGGDDLVNARASRRRSPPGGKGGVSDGEFYPTGSCGAFWIAIEKHRTRLAPAAVFALLLIIIQSRVMFLGIESFPRRECSGGCV